MEKDSKSDERNLTYLQTADFRGYHDLIVAKKAKQLRKRRRYDHVWKIRLLTPQEPKIHYDLDRLLQDVIESFSSLTSWQQQHSELLSDLRDVLAVDTPVGIERILNSDLLRLLLPFVNPTTPKTQLKHILQIVGNMACFSDDLASVIFSSGGLAHLINIWQIHDSDLLDNTLSAIFNTIGLNEYHAREALNMGLFRVIVMLGRIRLTQKTSSLVLRVLWNVIEELLEWTNLDQEELWMTIQRLSGFVGSDVQKPYLDIVAYLTDMKLPYAMTNLFLNDILQCLSPDRCQTEEITTAVHWLSRLVKWGTCELMNLPQQPNFHSFLVNLVWIGSQKLSDEVYKLCWVLCEAENIIFSLPYDSKILATAASDSVWSIPALKLLAKAGALPESIVDLACQSVWDLLTNEEVKVGQILAVLDFLDSLSYSDGAADFQQSGIPDLLVGLDISVLNGRICEVLSGLEETLYV